MTRQEITEQVIGIVVSELGVDRDLVSPDSSFANDLGADSLDSVELIMALEERFSMEIPDIEAEEIRTVGQAVDYIEKHLQQGGNPT